MSHQVTYTIDVIAGGGIGLEVTLRPDTDPPRVRPGRQPAAHPDPARRHVPIEGVLIDALAARLVLRPHSADVIVATNHFGDILSFRAAAVAGSIGVAPSSNLHPPRRHLSMFEPVHGSAHDITGTGVANPVGQMWAASLMLDHLAQPAAAKALVAVSSPRPVRLPVKDHPAAT